MNNNTYQENIIRTIHSMFVSRGYTDIAQTDTLISGEKKLAKGSEKVCAFFQLISKLNVERIQKYIAMMKEKNINHGIIVYEKITPAVNNVLQSLPSTNMILETFHGDSLQFDITKHRLTPQHIRLTKEQAQTIKNELGTNLPVLLKTDPISRFYNLTKGDIVKVIRKNGMIAYRIVK